MSSKEAGKQVEEEGGTIHAGKGATKDLLRFRAEGRPWEEEIQ